MKGQLVAFDDIEPTPVAPVRPRPRAARPSYTAYSGPERCDVCMAAHIESPAAPLARRARMRRAADGTVTLLCNEHGQIQRDADGVEKERK